MRKIHFFFSFFKFRNPSIAIPRDLPWKSSERKKRQTEIEIINNESKSKPVERKNFF